MKGQSKTVYILTITAIAAFCVMACVWLIAQYRASLQLQADSVYDSVIAAMNEQQEIRYKKAHEAGYNISVALRMQNSDSMYVDAYISNRFVVANVKDTLKEIDLSHYGEIFSGLEKQRIDLQGQPSTDDVHLASSQYISNISSPFSAEMLDSLLKVRGVLDAEIATHKADTTLWKPVRCDRISLMRPSLSVSVPYDTFNSECAEISVPLRGSAILGRMRVMLALTIIVAILLIYCFLYQLSTIKKLHEVDRLREEMMHKLIQERLREQSQRQDGRFQLGRLVFDTNTNCILDGETATHLTVRQSDILSLLTENLGKIVLRSEILNTIWGDDSSSNSLSLNVQLSHLRKILSADPSVTIVTVKGKGLMLNC